MGVRPPIVLLREGRPSSIEFLLYEMHEVRFLLAWRLDGALGTRSVVGFGFGHSDVYNYTLVMISRKAGRQFKMFTIVQVYPFAPSGAIQKSP